MSKSRFDVLTERPQPVTPMEHARAKLDLLRVVARDGDPRLKVLNAAIASEDPDVLHAALAFVGKHEITEEEALAHAHRELIEAAAKRAPGMALRIEIAGQSAADATACKPPTFEILGWRLMLHAPSRPTLLLPEGQIDLPLIARAVPYILPTIGHHRAPGQAAFHRSAHLQAAAERAAKKGA